jgi:adenylyl cyclase-associated protein
MADATYPSQGPNFVVVRPPRFGSSLTSSLLRLEAAASRFEDIASSIVPPGNSTVATITNGASAVAAVSKSASQPSINLPKTDTLPPEIEDYDTLINGDLATFVKLSQVLDPLLAEQVGVQLDITRGLG